MIEEIVMNDETKSTAMDRGQRARLLRKLSRYTRKAFAQKHGLKAATIQNWEDARYGGLSERGAILLAKAYQQEGFDCKPEWLLYGVGPEPTAKMPTPDAEKPTAADFHGQVMYELQFLQQTYPNLVHAIVADDAMQPMFFAGDHAAGLRLRQDQYASLANTPVIVQTTQGSIIFRVATYFAERGSVLLTNANNESEHVAIGNIFSIAPITWMRREVKS